MCQVKPYYIYVILATICLNLFVLAMPIYVMNIYDRVIPMASLSTMWAFTLGIMIILVFDFIIGAIRESLLAESADNIDFDLETALFERTMRMKMVDQQVSPGAFLKYSKLFVNVRNFLTSSALATLIDLPFILLFLAVIWYLGGLLVLVPLGGVGILLLASLPARCVKGSPLMIMLSLAQGAIQIEAISFLENLSF